MNELRELTTEELSDLYRDDMAQLSECVEPDFNVLLELNQKRAFSDVPRGTRLDVLDHQDGRQFAVIVDQNDGVWCGFEIMS